IDGSDFHVAWIALFAVGADAMEPYADLVLLLDRLGLPNIPIEPSIAAVQVIRPVVGRQLVGAPFEFETAFGDPVRISADGGPEVRMPLEVSFERIEAERHVVDASISIRDVHRDNDRAVVDQLDR